MIPPLQTYATPQNAKKSPTVINDDARRNPRSGAQTPRSTSFQSPSRSIRSADTSKPTPVDHSFTVPSLLSPPQPMKNPFASCSDVGREIDRNISAQIQPHTDTVLVNVYEKRRRERAASSSSSSSSDSSSGSDSGSDEERGRNPFDETPHSSHDETPRNPFDESPLNPFDETPQPSTNPFDEPAQSSINPFDETPINPFDETPHSSRDETPRNPFDETPTNPFDETPINPFDASSDFDSLHLASLQNRKERKPLNPFATDGEEAFERLVSAADLQQKPVVAAPIPQVEAEAREEVPGLSTREQSVAVMNSSAPAAVTRDMEYQQEQCALERMRVLYDSSRDGEERGGA